MKRKAPVEGLLFISALAKINPAEARKSRAIRVVAHKERPHKRA